MALSVTVMLIIEGRSSCAIVTFVIKLKRNSSVIFTDIPSCPVKDAIVGPVGIRRVTGRPVQQERFYFEYAALFTGMREYSVNGT